MAPAEPRRRSNVDRATEAGSTVNLHVYDISWLTAISSAIGAPAFHVGVEIYGAEYSYGGSGIATCKPGLFNAQIQARPSSKTTTGRRKSRPQTLAERVRVARYNMRLEYQYRHAVPIGFCNLTAPEIRSVLKDMRKTFTAKTYHLVSRNCQAFAMEFCERLGLGKDCIPDEFCRFGHVFSPDDVKAPAPTGSLLFSVCCQPRNAESVGTSVTIPVDDDNADVDYGACEDPFREVEKFSIDDDFDACGADVDEGWLAQELGKEWPPQPVRPTFASSMALRRLPTKSPGLCISQRERGNEVQDMCQNFTLPVETYESTWVSYQRTRCGVEPTAKHSMHTDRTSCPGPEASCDNQRHSPRDTSVSL